MLRRNSINHYLITVGTSQLDHQKLSLSDGRLKEALTRIVKGADSTQTQYHNLSQAILPVLQKEASRREDLAQAAGMAPKPRNNPWGAEITTLWNIQADTQHDYFHLLCSDSNAGKLAGHILNEYLQNVWGVSLDRISIKAVPDLKPCPDDLADAKKGLESLAGEVSTLLAQWQATTPAWRFVISGGFKSVIPVLTWFALAYDIPLEYIFEDSEHPIRDLTPKLDTAARNVLVKELKRLFPNATLPPKLSI